MALSNVLPVFFKFNEHFFIIFLKLNSFYFSFLRVSGAICRSPPEHLLTVALARMPTLVNALMRTNPFTAVSYKRPHLKHLSECVCACFRTRLSGEALTSMPHLLSRELVFASLYSHSTWLQQRSTKWALYCHVKLSVNRGLEWLFQYSVNIEVFLVA